MDKGLRSKRKDWPLALGFLKSSHDSSGVSGVYASNLGRLCPTRCLWIKGLCFDGDQESFRGEVWLDMDTAGEGQSSRAECVFNEAVAPSSKMTDRLPTAPCDGVGWGLYLSLL